MAAGTAAALSAAALLLARRRRIHGRRTLHDDPEPADLPYDLDRQTSFLERGFAAVDALRLVRQRARGVETDKVTITAERLHRALAEMGLGPVALLTAQETRRDVILAATSERAVHERLLDPEVWNNLEERLNCLVHVRRSVDGDLRVDLEHLRAADMAAIGVLASQDLWLPTGLLAQGERLHVNLASVEHLLIAGRAGPDPATLLASLVLSVAVVCTPSELAIAILRTGESLAPELDALPHVQAVVSATDAKAVTRVLAGLQNDLVERVAGEVRPVSGQQEKLLVLEDLSAFDDVQGPLAGILAHGAAHGIHVLAASTVAHATAQLPGAFHARIVLQLADEESSVHVLGRPGAEQLAGGGDAWLRVGGREPLRLRAFRVEPADLQECVALMRRSADSFSQTEETMSTESTSEERDDVLSEVVETWEEQGRHGNADPDGSFGPAVDLPATEGQAEPPSRQADEQSGLPVEQDEGKPGDLEREQGTGKLLEVHCFGPFEVVREGTPVLAWERPDVRAILAFLALRAPGAVHRDQVIEAIWPNKDADQGRKFLNNRVSSLRQAIERRGDRSALRFQGDQYRLDRDRVWIDVVVFDELLARARKIRDQEVEALLAEAVDLYRGELFADGCPDWAVESQETYRVRALEALNRAAACAARRGDDTLAIARYRRAMALEPINEEIASNLARALHRQKDRVGVVRLRGALLEALRRELDDPDAELQPETQNLFDEVQADLEASRSERKVA